MEYSFKLLSSLEKVFFGDLESFPEHTHGSMLKNEIYSFQLAGWVLDPNRRVIPCKLEIESSLTPFITVYQVGYVPSLVPTYNADADDDYITKTPGLFPDPLYKTKDRKLDLVSSQSRSFWISVEPKGNLTGTYPIILRLFEDGGEKLTELCYTITIIDAALPKQKLLNTGWFHGDCIAVAHNVEIMSEAYFDLVDKYLEVYTKFGHNTILTPVFTPPLDTAVGSERPTNQLVDVTLQDGKYSFGFDKLKRWISMCQKRGIEYFEICHFFTQWGARYSPKIMATVNGTYQKLFGWEVEALSQEYQDFLRAFLPELKEFLTKEGVMEHCLFHVSDEPGEGDLEQYEKVKKLMLEFLDESQCIDALGNYQFYERGVIKHPVVSLNHMKPFLENNVKDLWAYYCCAQYKDVPNRFMAMPSYRNRILGYQLYKYRIKGFLQWGFNFWFKALSKGAVDPYADTTAGGAFPAGDSFMVYPVNEDGEVVCSHRLYVFMEGLQDMRALELLEELTDRRSVEALLGEIEGFDRYPRNGEYILKLRKLVNQKIQAAMRK